MLREYTFPNLLLPVYLGLALVAGLTYLAISYWGYGYLGFPLDDAWIHQTYARNLARSGQLAFVPGLPSAGSTAPLWSFLLSLGYVLGIPFKIWAYGLGIVLLGLTGWTVHRLGQTLFPESQGVGLGAGLFCIFEWHLTWAALSGMETLLFVWLSLFLLERYVACSSARGSAANAPPQMNSNTLCPPRAFLYLGLTGGLLTLTRPEGLGLVGLIGLHTAYRHTIGRDTRGRVWFGSLLKKGLLLTLGIFLLLIPYIAFHLWATGLPFPNTLYAKQAEYGVILSDFPLWWRLFGNLGPVQESVQGVFRVIFIGPQILLGPGLLFSAWLTLKERRDFAAMIWLWWTSYLVLYAIRLPVTYQHGRYQIPVIAWVVLLGVWGTSRLFQRPARNATQQMLLRVGSRAITLSLALLLLGFVVLGGQAYGRDVRIIESEMVATAKWLDQNTAPDVLIAAHDIGAVGYFAERPLLDLAGLVTPEVIPIIRDEPALFEFMTARQVDYVVTFPSWYPVLTRQAELNPRFTTDAPWAPQAGGDNMVVYELLPSKGR